MRQHDERLDDLGESARGCALAWWHLALKWGVTVGNIVLQAHAARAIFRWTFEVYIPLPTPRIEAFLGAVLIAHLFAVGSATIPKKAERVRMRAREGEDSTRDILTRGALRAFGYGFIVAVGHALVRM